MEDAPAITERVGTFLTPRVHRSDRVAASMMVQAHRIEICDEAGAEHGDCLGFQGGPSPLICIDNLAHGAQRASGLRNRCQPPAELIQLAPIIHGGGLFEGLGPRKRPSGTAY